MELNFDKEMDALLRQTAQRDDFVLNKSAAHLDADEISAFAENALPEKTKERYILHLADCDKCRKSLSSLITLNAAQESEIAPAEKTEIVSVAIPWYRKLFAVPNLAYTLGALVLVFSGIAVFTILQNSGNLQNSEVSQTYEKQPNGKGMSSDGDDGAVSESYSSNQMMSNSALTNANLSANESVPAIISAPQSAANSNSVMSEKSDKDARNESKSESPTESNQLSETQDAKVVAVPPPAPAKENEYSPETQTQNQTQNQQNSGSQNQTTLMPDSRSVQVSPKPSGRTPSKSKNMEELRDDTRKKSVTAATTTVGGKTFKSADNVWYDSAYRGQKTINLTRGTNEYKKLDSNLRGIVENLGGTVVIVWKEKAYRIQ